MVTGIHLLVILYILVMVELLELVVEDVVDMVQTNILALNLPTVILTLILKLVSMEYSTPVVEVVEVPNLLEIQDQMVDLVFV